MKQIIGGRGTLGSRQLVALRNPQEAQPVAPASHSLHRDSLHAGASPLFLSQHLRMMQMEHGQPTWFHPTTFSPAAVLRCSLVQQTDI